MSGQNVKPRRAERPAAPEAAAETDRDAELAAWAGERLRRVALGATAALIVARAFWPSEPDLAADAGGGLDWVLTLMVVAGLGLAGAIVGGNLRFRWSWADIAVVALAALAGAGAGHAADRRVAINLAWEWGGLAVAYVLVRNLPKTRGESLALLGALAATAVAVAVYGLFQAGVELPELQRKFANNPAFRADAMRALGVAPGTAAEVQLRNRLLHSNEVYSTFALANSLAGFLVGPLVVMLGSLWDNLSRRDGKAPRLGAVVFAMPPIAAVIVCLTLTKCRSAYIGLAVALAVLAWRERSRVGTKALIVAAAGVALVVAALVAGGLATGRLDRQVLTESDKSFRYRREYWVGAWRAINESSNAFWWGFGPGNFQAPYLRHKLPESSEEIFDPHNLALEAWSTAGVWAVVALGAALVVGIGNTFRVAGGISDESDGPPLPLSESPRGPSDAPRSPGWLIACAGAGWLAVLAVGEIDLIGGGQFDRWMILGASWALAVGLGVSLARRRPVEPAVVGAAALAVVITLSAVGGIGIPAVALALWTLVALGLNLRDDRACGRLRGPIGRVSGFAVAALWAAMLGTLVGAVGPYRRAGAAMRLAEDALRARPPNLQAAEDNFNTAKAADPLSARPWLALAGLDHEVWTERGARPGDLRWRKVPIEMLGAVTKPRSSQSWTRHRERARMTSLLIKQLGSNIKPIDATKLRADVVHASRTAARLYPTNPSLRAWLAEASADIRMIPDALTEGREALRLDALTPHLDKKLEPSVRRWLESKIPEWEAAAGKGMAVDLPRR